MAGFMWILAILDECEIDVIRLKGAKFNSPFFESHDFQPSVFLQLYFFKTEGPHYLGHT
jgi:hypothetical protein